MAQHVRCDLFIWVSDNWSHLTIHLNLSTFEHFIFWYFIDQMNANQSIMKIICYWLTLCFSENISKLLNGFHSSIYRQQMKYVVVLFWKKKKFNLCFLTWHQLILSPFPMGTLFYGWHRLQVLQSLSPLQTLKLQTANNMHRAVIWTKHAALMEVVKLTRLSLRWPVFNSTQSATLNAFNWFCHL